MTESSAIFASLGGIIAFAVIANVWATRHQGAPRDDGSAKRGDGSGASGGDGCDF